MMGQRIWRIMLVLTLFGLAPAVQAHQSGNSYLQISGEMQAGLKVQLDFAIKDINGLLQLPPAQQKEISRAALQAMQPAITATVAKSLTLEADGAALSLTFEAQSVTVHNDGLYVRQNYTTAGSTAQADYLLVHYDFFNEDEKLARALFKLAVNGSEVSSVFDARHAVQRFALRNVPLSDTLFVFAREGALHIWSGPDHLLFLLCLLLPGLMLAGAQATGLPARLSPPLFYALKVVTAFTLAHSLTLLAATMDWVALPDRWIEAAIAGSIIVAALLNLTRTSKNHHWKFAFGFGLIHGLGFANGLRELGLSQTHFIETLLAFNLGVEFGQLVVVLAAGVLVLPFLKRAGFAAGMLRWGSLLTIVVAGGWLAERLIS
jgi:hypothetical protein